jgi:hypothetical protein
MKKLEESTITKLQASVAQFSSDSLKQLDPKQSRELLQKKMNEFKSSDEENKFVTYAAFMNLGSAIVQISF